MPAADDSLGEFFKRVRSSCEEHARRKGYTKQGPDEGNVLGPMMKLLGTAQDHALGEILTKVVECKAHPRKVLAEKIAGWAHRLWLSCEE